MHQILPEPESDQCLSRFYSALETSGTAWDTALIFGRVNQYYLAGTMQDAVLVLRRSGDAHLFVRRSYERAVEESPLANVHAIQSYRDMRTVLPEDLGTTFIESEQVTLAVPDRLKKYFTFSSLQPLDGIICRIRAVKSPYELEFLRAGGREHDELLTHFVPELLNTGMSEAQLFGELYRSMMEMNHQGIVRLSGFGTEMQIGQIGFGTTTLAPTSFDGPSGMRGVSAIVPSVRKPRPTAYVR